MKSVHLKSIVLGIVIGSLVSSIIPIKAAVEEYVLQKSDCKLVVNGQTVDDSKYKVLNKDGINYMAVAAIKPIVTSIGGQFNFDNNTKTISINTSGEGVSSINSTTQTQTTNDIQYNESTGLPIGAEYIEYKDCKKAIKYNGKIYVSQSNLYTKFKFKSKTVIDNKAIFEKDGVQVSIDLSNKNLAYNVGAVMYFDISLFSIGE